MFMSHLCLLPCICVSGNRVSHGEGKAALRLVGFTSVVILLQTQAYL